MAVLFEVREANLLDAIGKQEVWRSLPRSSSAAALALLNGWAFNVAVGTEDAAMSLFWPQHSRAVRAVPEELTGIGRHCLRCRASAFWTSDRGDKLDRAHASTLIKGASIYPHIAEMVTKTVARPSSTSVCRAGGAVLQELSFAHALRRRR